MLLKRREDQPVRGRIYGLPGGKGQTGGMFFGNGGETGRKEASCGEGIGAGGQKTGKAQEQKLRFTYKEQKEWETIEETISGLEEEIAGLETEILKAATDYGRLNQLMKDKAEKEALLEEKMERWMYLNELAERIAAQK